MNFIATDDPSELDNSTPEYELGWRASRAGVPMDLSKSLEWRLGYTEANASSEDF